MFSIFPAFPIRVVLGSVCLIVLGCGGAESLSVPETSDVSGTVIFQDEPLSNATIRFISGGSQQSGGAPVGKTDEHGLYTLRTIVGPRSEGAGAVPGTYKVVISKMSPPDGMTEADFQEKVDTANKIAETGIILSEAQQPPSLVELLSPSYSSLSKTELTAVVEAGEANSIDFVLE